MLNSSVATVADAAPLVANVNTIKDHIRVPFIAGIMLLILAHERRSDARGEQNCEAPDAAAAQKRGTLRRDFSCYALLVASPDQKNRSALPRPHEPREEPSRW